MAETAHRVDRVTANKEAANHYVKHNVAANKTIYHGVLAFPDASGDATDVITVSGECLGVAVENGYDNSAVGSATTIRPLAVETGQWEEVETIGGAAIADGTCDKIGHTVGATDNWTFITPPGTNPVVGYIAGLNKAGDKFLVAIEPQRGS